MHKLQAIAYRPRAHTIERFFSAWAAANKYCSARRRSILYIAQSYSTVSALPRCFTMFFRIISIHHQLQTLFPVLPPRFPTAGLLLHVQQLQFWHFRPGNRSGSRFFSVFPSAASSLVKYKFKYQLDPIDLVEMMIDTWGIGNCNSDTSTPT